MGITLASIGIASRTGCQHRTTDNLQSLQDMHAWLGFYNNVNVQVTANKDSSIWSINQAGTPVVTIDFNKDAVKDAWDKGKNVYQVVMIRAKNPSPKMTKKNAYDCHFGFFQNSYDVATVSDGGDLTIMLNGGSSNVQANSNKNLVNISNKPAVVTVQIPKPGRNL